MKTLVKLYEEETTKPLDSLQDFYNFMSSSNEKEDDKDESSSGTGKTS